MMMVNRLTKPVALAGTFIHSLASRIENDLVARTFNSFYIGGASAMVFLMVSSLEVSVANGKLQKVAGTRNFHPTSEQSRFQANQIATLRHVCIYQKFLTICEKGHRFHVATSTG
jgi:hypothetical protein